MRDYYQVLEIAPGAPQAAIKEQYRFLVQAWHPDKFRDPAQKLKAGEKLKEINAAYEVLRDPAKRAEYNSRIGHAHSSYRREHREKTTWRESDDERRRKEEARRAKEEHWQKERANRAREEAERRHAESIRRQRLTQLDQEISLQEQEIKRLSQGLPRMPSALPGILFFVGGVYGSCFSLSAPSDSIGLLVLSLGAVSIFIGVSQFSRRNRIYREECKPALVELERQRQLLRQLLQERQHLKGV